VAARQVPDRTRGEVRVCSEWESRAVMEVIDVVDRWLAADGIASAKLSIGDRSHTLVGAAWPATTGGRAAGPASFQSSAW
jgi:hypothetical protein